MSEPAPADTPPVNKTTELPNPFLELSDPTLRLAGLRLRLIGIVVAQMIWNKMLSADDRTALGGDFVKSFEEFQDGIAMWRRCHPMTMDRAIIKIAHGVNLLSDADYRWLMREIAAREFKIPPSRRTGMQPVDPEDDPNQKIEDAVDDHKLVLVEGAGFRRVYWQGKRVMEEWTTHEKPWELLVELARQAKDGLGVDRHRLNGAKGDKTIIYRKSRLKKMIPAELDALIESIDQGTYKLRLPGADICILELQADQWELDLD